MKFPRRSIRDFLIDRAGSGTTKLAVGAFAILLTALIVGDELARLAQNDALPKIDIARNTPMFRSKEVDATPTGAIPDKHKGLGRSPCEERNE